MTGPLRDAETAASLPQTARRLLLPTCLSLLFLGIALVAAAQHPYCTYAVETDFYQYYAPDAARLAAGEFPQDPYRGPGYAFTIMLLKTVTSDYFVAGKWLTVVSAALAAFLTFLIFDTIFGYWPAVAAQVLMMVAPQYLTFAVEATTDIYFLMLTLAALAVFLCDRLPANWRVGLAGTLTGLAYLTRYNGLSLVAALLVSLLLINPWRMNWRWRLQKSVVFLGLFTLVCLPWLIMNTLHRGSPFANSNYLNIATEYYPELAGGSNLQEGTRGLSSTFHSLWEVISYAPKRMLTHYPDNLFDSVRASLRTDLVDWRIGYLGLVGLALALLLKRSRRLFVLLVALLFTFLLLALTHWETRYYFFVLVIYAGLAGFAIVQPFFLLATSGRLPRVVAWILPVFLLAWLSHYSVQASRKEANRFLSSHPTEIIAASEFVIAQNLQQPRIVARKPHLSYMSHGKWVFFPQVKSLNELHDWLAANPVDYLAFGIWEAQTRPELRVLQNAAEAPNWLQPLWVNEQPPFVLYKPSLDEPAATETQPAGTTETLEQP